MDRQEDVSGEETEKIITTEVDINASSNGNFGVDVGEDKGNTDQMRDKDNKDEEARVVNKVTLHLVPFLSVLYLLCYLDRANLGNAHTEMVKDLNISESEYAASVSIYFIGYVLCEVPANCMMELVQARRWLARIMFTWGVISTSLAAVHQSLLVLRLLLGIAEAGFFPGAIFYLTQWFTESERAGKISIMSSSSALAGLVGGITAYWILHLDGFLGIKGWRWIFILEGIPSVIVAVVTLMYLPDTPQDAKWLTQAEKTIIINRMKNQRSSHVTTPAPRELTLANFVSLIKVYIGEMRNTFQYLSTWIFGLSSFFILFTMGSTVFFLPAVVQEFSSSAMTSNLLNAIPFAFAVVILNINSRHSDKTKERPFHIIGMCAVGIFGYILVLIGFLHDWGIVARMIAISVAVAGQWSAFTPLAAWISICVQGNRAVGIAAASSIGGIAGWIAPTIQARCYEATGNYTLGLMVCGASLLCACCSVLAAKYQMIKVEKTWRKRKSTEMEVLVSQQSDI